MTNKETTLPVHLLESHAQDDISFEINRFRRMHPDVKASYPHRNLFYTIHYVERGKGSHIIDFESFPVGPEAMFFITPGQVHFWQLKGLIQGWVIKFKEDFLLFSSLESGILDRLDFFHNVGGIPAFAIEKDQKTAIAETLRLMGKEYESDSYGRVENLQCYLRIFLNQIQRIFVPQKDLKKLPKRTILIKDFKTILSKNFLSERCLSFYANKLGVSEFHLHDLVKKAFGITPGQMIRNEIVLEAKRSLAHTDITIAEIAYNLEFEDPSYFSRFFKRETGISPGTFRTKIREKYRIFPA